MKSILRSSLALALAALIGCSQNQQPTSPETASLAQDQSVSSLEKSLPKITVPDDYATIQAAVDAAVGATKINVKSGTYTEAVTINKPGLVLGATGTVTLNGGFSLTADADNVTIRNFNIFTNSSVFAGIYANGVTGGKAEDNTVTGGSDFESGIFYENSTGATIKDNTVSGTNFGIYLKNSSGNTVDENTATGVINSTGIALEANSDNNKITGNFCTGNDGGISTNSFTTGATSDNNEFKDNTCNNNIAHGIDLLHANNNTVTGNTSNNNGAFGILVRDTSNNNTVKKNTAFGNTTCDITNLAGNSGNVFTKNSASCTSGF